MEFLRKSGPILLSLLISGLANAQDYDLVILNGRVMDPETNFDAVRNVGVKDGRIARITEDKISGDRTIDASGLVVAPGFIDTHVHGHDPFTMKVLARDGVTSIMDLEYGSLQIAKYYEAHEGASILNYGQGVSHEYARMAVLDGIVPTESTFVYHWRAEAAKDGESSWVSTTPNEEQIQEILQWMDRGLAEGALSVSSTVGYFQAAATSREVYEVQKLGASWERMASFHPRMGPHDVAPQEYPLGFKEVIANAVSLGQPLLCNHINFAGWQETQEILVGLRKHGQVIWGEMYPWVAGGPSAGAAITSPENLKSWGFKIEESVLDPETGEYLSEQEYRDLRESDPGKNMVVFTRPKEWPAQLVATPDLALVSDALASFSADDGFSPQNYPDFKGGVLPYDFEYEKFKGHPRVAGSRGKSFRLARENNVPLMLVVNNASYFSAKMLGKSGIKFFDERGRMQEGMVADITIFDPETIRENSDYLPGKNGLPTTGIPYVLVNGSVVVDDSKVDITQFPGLPIRFKPEAPRI